MSGDSFYTEDGKEVWRIDGPTSRIWFSSLLILFRKRFSEVFVEDHEWGYILDVRGYHELAREVVDFFNSENPDPKDTDACDTYYSDESSREQFDALVNSFKWSRALEIFEESLMCFPERGKIFMLSRDYIAPCDCKICRITDRQKQAFGFVGLDLDEPITVPQSDEVF